MLDLWRPPAEAGQPVGCLATTYTFDPELFDEACLGRFLDIESDPAREGLAFQVERYQRLGGVYAAVLVDQSHAGVEHALQWDVLPARIRNGIQHAKLSLLVWSRHVRIIVASANLTVPGYRTNREVAIAVDITPERADLDLLNEATAFLHQLVQLVPGSGEAPESQRALSFLERVHRQTRQWRTARRRRLQRLVCTLPPVGGESTGRSSLVEAVDECRGHGGLPREVWVGSPFFDGDVGARQLVTALCRRMARGKRRDLWFGVPAVRDDAGQGVPRLEAPVALVEVPPEQGVTVGIEVLPDSDGDQTRRWHAKMVAFQANRYSALMIGSSNFTRAGMGIGGSRNAEANLLTVLDVASHRRQARQLEDIWPLMEALEDPESAEWLGPQADPEEGLSGDHLSPPEGFLLASYRAGPARQVVLFLDSAGLPTAWQVQACGPKACELLTAKAWRAAGKPSPAEIAWAPIQPPERLLVRWNGLEAFLPFNVEDRGTLPPPPELESMSADDMLWILAAPDPSAAARAWASRQRGSDGFDGDIDSATPADLDPLRRYDLHATFLHRIRRRGRVLAQLRANLERPVWRREALEWRLRGPLGIAALTDRLLDQLKRADRDASEALLSLADVLIVLCEVDYPASTGAMTKKEFRRHFRRFLKELAARLTVEVATLHGTLSRDVMGFWTRAAERCRT